MSGQRYTRTAIALHWLMALLILGLLGVGLTMTALPLSPFKLQVYSWHKWAGVSAFLLVCLRLAWRLGHRPPALPPGIPGWQRHAAHGLHHLLYLLMFAIPLTGWLMSSAKGFQTVWFGVLPLPDLLPRDEALGDLLKRVHAGLNYGLIALLAAHVGAALKHHWIDRDDILVRILPWRGRR